MKRMTAGRIVGAMMCLLGIAPDARAADLGSGHASQPAQMCLIMPRSQILDLANSSDMQREVDRRYQHALQVSLADNTIASRSPRFVWSNEAKIACGKAVGYFAGSEINEEMISKCDCYHRRMLVFMY